MNDTQSGPPSRVETTTEVWTARFLPARQGQSACWRVRGPGDPQAETVKDAPYLGSIPVGVVIGDHTETLRNIVASAAGGLVSDLRPAQPEDADPLSGWHPSYRLTVVRPSNRDVEPPKLVKCRRCMRPIRKGFGNGWMAPEDATSSCSGQPHEPEDAES